MQLNLTTILKFLKKNQGSFKLTALSMLVLVMPAFAQTGSTSTDSGSICATLGYIESILKGISVVVVTLAVMWAGYKFLFMRAEVSECAKILVAGVLIGSASFIAQKLTSQTECVSTGATISVNSNTATFAHVTSPFQSKVLSLINEA